MVIEFMLKRKINKKTLLLPLILALSACATAYQGTKQKITITSTPQNAEVMTSHGYGCDSTPCSFYVPRNSSFQIKVAKPGFSTEMVTIKPVLSSVGTAQSLGSIVLGGVVAGGYDVYNGAVLALSPNRIDVKLENMSALLHEEVRLVSNMDLFEK
tara:strand:- start:381 stop:848 length:468 start_codon:yes stop_codon:yes gene_type:complete